MYHANWYADNTKAVSTVLTLMWKEEAIAYFDIVTELFEGTEENLFLVRI
jgi:hypothetical protein